MLDTNTCIYIIKKKPQHIINKILSLKISDLGISVITLSELEYGVQKSSNPIKNQNALIEFLSPIEIAAFNEEAARYYGEIRTNLEKNGQLIGSMDMLIAAHAKSLSVRLVTNNIKEFKKIPGLIIENWVS